ncbi:MAG: N-methyl-L-tryptophan oxidase [Gemmatimonadaceae bacterium]
MVDVIIVGLGAMGSAASYELARRGKSVLGIDQFSPPHDLGSTHGRSRIIREAYFEDPAYVPIVQRAYELWRALEREAGDELLLITGGVMIGDEHGTLVHGARTSAERHGLPHELLDARETRRRFPGLEPPDEMVALLEPRAGVLKPERCVTAFLSLAGKHGATLNTNERVIGWRATDAGVSVRTTRRAYEAEQLVLTAGPWLPELLSGTEGHGLSTEQLTVERQLFHWYAPAAHAAWFAPRAMPISLWEYEPEKMFAAFADLGDGVKFGIHHEGERTDPARVRREVTPADDETMGALVRRFMPNAFGALRESRVCLYTNTPDHHFLIDRLPCAPSVLVASPCSGHGFKFASAIGEIVADLVTGGASRFDLSLFAAGRARERRDGI